MDFSISNVANKMATGIIIVSIVIAVGGVFLYPYPVAFVVGVALATVTNVAKVFLLKRAIEKVSTMTDSNKAKIYFSGQYFFRMVLTGIMLLGAWALPDAVVSLVGAAVGLFAYMIAMHLLKFILPKEFIEPDQSFQDQSFQESKGE